MAEQSSPLLELIKEQGKVDDLQYEEVIAEHGRTGKPVNQILQDFGILDIDSILQIEADYLGTEVVSLRDREFTPDLIRAIPGSTARMYQCVPVAVHENSVQVAFVEPLIPGRSDELGFAIRKDIIPVVADPAQIEKAIERYYGEDTESVSDILKDLGADKDIAREVSAAAADVDNVAMLADIANELPIVRFVNLVLFQAVQDRASDIHFEPFEDEFKIRYRVDGALYEMAPPPKHLALPIISRVKVMSNLNIAERRMPQDGRIQLNIAGRQVDLRVSTLPTQFGESLVLRVLDRSIVNLDLEALGMPDYIYNFLLEMIERPNGIFIATGPTGCRKTTTLYSCLRRVN